MTFKDYFSAHAADYRRYRPRYPAELFAWLAALPPARELAWDCGTGNGQAAVMLAEHFERVVATDASADQVALAQPHANVEYIVAPAERSPLDDGTVDLVMAAQAAHWFDLPGFYAEVRRVARPGGIVALSCYALATINPAVDQIVRRLYSEILGPYWPPERKVVEDAYATLPFPFEEILSPTFQMRERWDLDQLAGYLHTWSSAQRYHRQHKKNPVELIYADLAAAWGDPLKLGDVTWPIALRVGRAN